ncbi:MAG: zinc-dependent metalloprotease [Myxococcales bacterium]|nr:zinc-dependent metalloprotease [Myxococcales bacterium]
MKVMRHVGAWAAAGALFALAGCAETVKDIDRTQPNALKKEMFSGEWYFARTVVDVPYEGDGTFIGDRQEYFFGEDFPALKIRWRIEEDRLMACRVDDIVIGGNSDGRGEEVDPQKAEARAANDAEGEAWRKFPCDHPVASFHIQSHFDIIRDYNASTGEQSNVIRENTSDRPWHERDYFRIDWTDIGLTDLNFSIFAQRDMGWIGLESPYYVQEEAGDCRTTDANGKVSYADCDEGFLPPMFDDDAFMLTNRVTVVPADGLISCAAGLEWGYTTPCTLSEIGMRYAFMRVPERAAEEQYEILQYPDRMWERFGVWRVNKRTFTPGRGETDFKQYYGTRWHLWEKTQNCSGDTCSPLALGERSFRPITYHLNRAFPNDLKPTAFKLAKEWNDAFDGIHPTIDVVSECQVKCGEGAGKPLEQCTGADSNFRMEGKCAWVLKENDGQQFMGDLRYNFIAYIEDAGQSQPCGVGGPANDPETGELINATAYVYGAGCFDTLVTRLNDMVDIICAQAAQNGEELPASCDAIGEDEYLRGVRTLEIMQNQGYVQGPSTPIRTQTASGQEFAGDGFVADLDGVRQNFEELRHNRGRLQSRRQRFLQTGIYKSMIPDQLALEISKGRTNSAADLTEAELEFFNPMDPRTVLNGTRHLVRDKLAMRGVESADYLFSEAGLWAFAQSHKDLSREAFLQLLREESFRAVTLHELGHNMGLRHNFIASFDRANFPAEYWRIKRETEAAFEAEYGRPAPNFDINKDDDETEEAFYQRYRQWDADRQLLRKMQADAGIKEYRYASIMDYGGLWYRDWKGLGSYDKAAMRFLYAGLVDRIQCNGRSPEECADALTGTRQHVPWYMGGELCNADSDCPYNAAGQKCRLGPNNTSAKFCSNWDDDEVTSGRFNPRQKFCSDERVVDQPFCNRWDEGESSEEIVRNMIELYQQGFVFNNFRRYRLQFNGSSYFRRIFLRYFSTIGDQMQSLLYKYFYEPGFRQLQGPGGFDDMFRATVIGFDFIGNVLAEPEAGSYEWNETAQMYEHVDERLVENPGRDFVNVPLGMGAPIYSSYESTYFGEIERLSYIGRFYDKIAAIWTLTLRDWGASTLANEQRFQLSFYDFFPRAFTRLLGAAIAGDLGAVGPIYDPETKTATQLTFWDGNFFSDDDGFDPDNVNPEGRHLEAGIPTQLGQWALIETMLSTPVWFDLSMANGLRIFELGGETGFSIEGLDPNEYRTCDAPLSNRTFVAVRTENVESVAWRTVNRCRTIAERFQALQQAVETGVLPEGKSLNQVEAELRDTEFLMSSTEDNLSNMVFLIDILGIGSL